MYTLLPNKTERIFFKLFKMFEDIPHFSPKRNLLNVHSGLVSEELTKIKVINLIITFI